LSLIIDKMMRNLEWKLVYQAPQVMIHWPSKLLTDHRKSALDYIHTLFCSPATIFIADGHDLFSFCSFGTGQAKNSLTHSLIFLAITLTVKGRAISLHKKAQSPPQWDKLAPADGWRDSRNAYIPISSTDPHVRRGYNKKWGGENTTVHFIQMLVEQARWWSELLLGPDDDKVHTPTFYNQNLEYKN